MIKYIKKFLKKVSSQPIVQKTISWIAHFYIVFVFNTSKIIYKIDEKELDKLFAKGKGIIVFCWHGRIFMSPTIMHHIFKEYLKTKKINVLASASRDGKIVSEILKTFGFKIIEGSSINPKKGSLNNKKSLTSLRTLLRKLENDEVCVLAIDGPRGPSHKITTKITEMVKITSTPMIPVSISLKRKIQFKTWDEFQLPFPFNKILVEFDKSVIVKKDDDYMKVNKYLEDKLVLITKKNDNFFE